MVTSSAPHNSSPLTPALSPEERETPPVSLAILLNSTAVPQRRGSRYARLPSSSNAPCLLTGCRRFSLSFGERAGVRGNRPCELQVEVGFLSVAPFGCGFAALRIKEQMYFDRGLSTGLLLRDKVVVERAMGFPFSI